MKKKNLLVVIIIVILICRITKTGNKNGYGISIVCKLISLKAYRSAITRGIQYKVRSIKNIGKQLTAN